LNVKIKELNDEQENLLVLLTEMEVKLKKYKRMAKQHGHEVSEDEDEAAEEVVEPLATNIEKKLVVKPQQEQLPFKFDQEQQPSLNNINSQFHQHSLPPVLLTNEPPKPQIAHSIFTDSNPSNNINLTSTNANHHHHNHRDHHHDHSEHEHDDDDNYEDEPEINDNEKKFTLSDYRSKTSGGNTYLTGDSEGEAGSASALKNQHFDLEPTLNFPKNNIFQIIESNAMASHSSDNSSLTSDHYNNINNSTSSSSNHSHNHVGNFSPENPILQAMPPTNPMHEIKFNQEDPQSSQVSSQMNNYPNGINVNQQSYGQPPPQMNPPQFNFLQYFNNPSQTEQFKIQVGGQANKPLNSYFQ
jgi:hypothetical protein